MRSLKNCFIGAFCIHRNRRNGKRNRPGAQAILLDEETPNVWPWKLIGLGVLSLKPCVLLGGNGPFGVYNFFGNRQNSKNLTEFLMICFTSIRQTISKRFLNNTNKKFLLGISTLKNYPNTRHWRGKFDNFSQAWFFHSSFRVTQTSWKQEFKKFSEVPSPFKKGMKISSKNFDDRVLWSP